MADRDTGVGAIDLDRVGTDTEPSRRDRLRSWAARWFALRPFVVQALLAAVGVLVVGGLLPLGGLGAVLGILVAGFVTGLTSERRGYAEAAVAGALVGGAWAIVGNPVLALLGLGSSLVSVGLVGGGFAASLGHYFGRDLRDGLTRDL